MKNEYKEIESRLRKSLELWSDVMTESNQLRIKLDFTDVRIQCGEHHEFYLLQYCNKVYNKRERGLQSRNKCKTSSQRKLWN